MHHPCFTSSTVYTCKAKGSGFLVFAVMKRKTRTSCSYVLESHELIPEFGVLNSKLYFHGS